MRVNAAAVGSYTYPDVTVVCGSTQLLDDEFRKYNAGQGDYVPVVQVSWHDAQALLQWGFRSFTHAPVAQMSQVYKVRVRRGAIDAHGPARPHTILL